MDNDERAYRDNELPRVRKAVGEHIRELGDIGKCMRLRGLYDRHFDVWRDIRDIERNYEKAFKAGENYLTRAIIITRQEALEKELISIRGEMKQIAHAGRDSVDITPEMIERAREYPLSNLLDIGRNGLSRCISGKHEDNSPSMDCRNNFAYCHACGYSGDSIDVAMKVRGYNFRKAVMELL